MVRIEDLQLVRNPNILRKEVSLNSPATGITGKLFYLCWMIEIHVEWLNSLKINDLGYLSQFQTPSKAIFQKGKSSLSISIWHSICELTIPTCEMLAKRTAGSFSQVPV